VDANRNRAFRQKRGTHVTGREDGQHPASADAPFEDRGDDAKNEDRQNGVDNAIDPKSAAGEHEDRMLRQVVDVGTREPQDRVAITPVEHPEHDAGRCQ
jgi:hypothetical protein